jgi:hypothetical protein
MVCSVWLAGASVPPVVAVSLLDPAVAPAWSFVDSLFELAVTALGFGVADAAAVPPVSAALCALAVFAAPGFDALPESVLAAPAELSGDDATAACAVALLEVVDETFARLAQVLGRAFLIA